MKKENVMHKLALSALSVSLSLAVGSNQVLGTTGASGGVVDRDYFTFTLPANTRSD